MKQLNKLWVKATSLALVVLMLCSPLSEAKSEYGLSANGLSLSHEVRVPGGDKLVSVEAANASVRELLRDMSSQGGFNLILDPSIQGTITLELQNVSIDNALSAISNLVGIEILPRSANIFLAIAKDAAVEKGLNRRLTKMIKVKFGNATQIAALLNSSLFAIENAQLSQVGGSGGQGGGSGGGLGGGSGGIGQFQKIKPDPRTNSLIIIGSQRDIDLAEAAVKQMDRPRLSRTFYLSYANALDVATQLTSSIYNDGTAGLLFQGGGGGSGGGAGGGQGGGAGGSAGGGAQSRSGPMQLPSSLRVQSEKVEEGSGINNLTGGDGSTSSFTGEITLRGTVKSTETVRVSPLGPIVVPDTRLNAVTVMGTAQQIQSAAELIPILDAAPPQVSIEVSMIEITEDGMKEFSTQQGIADGRLQLGFNNEPLAGLADPTGLAPAGSGLIGLPSNDPNEAAAFARSGASFSSQPVVDDANFMFQLNGLVNSRRAKVLANPTIVATHDTESIISMVEEIIRRVNVTVDGQTGTTTIETELGEAGIVLDILPKVGEDGTVSMRIRPSITSIRSVIRTNNNITTLLTKRDVLAQTVRIKDGQTLVLGGLVNESKIKRMEKLPFLGDLPIVGALFRASTNQHERSEVVILLTPHIIRKTKVTPVHYSDPLASY